jgi:hypothetical protein
LFKLLITREIALSIELKVSELNKINNYIKKKIPVPSVIEVRIRLILAFIVALQSVLAYFYTDHFILFCAFLIVKLVVFIILIRRTFIIIRALYRMPSSETLNLDLLGLSFKTYTNLGIIFTLYASISAGLFLLYLIVSVYGCIIMPEENLRLEKQNAEGLERIKLMNEKNAISAQKIKELNEETRALREETLELQKRRQSLEALFVETTDKSQD